VLELKIATLSSTVTPPSWIVRCRFDDWGLPLPGVGHKIVVGGNTYLVQEVIFVSESRTITLNCEKL